MPNGHNDDAWDYQQEITSLVWRLAEMRSARANDAQDMQQLRAEISHLRALLREVRGVLQAMCEYRPWEGPTLGQLIDKMTAALEGCDARL